MRVSGACDLPRSKPSQEVGRSGGRGGARPSLRGNLGLSRRAARGWRDEWVGDHEQPRDRSLLVIADPFVSPAPARGRRASSPEIVHPEGQSSSSVLPSSPPPVRSSASSHPIATNFPAWLSLASASGARNALRSICQRLGGGAPMSSEHFEFVGDSACSARARIYRRVSSGSRSSFEGRTRTAQRASRCIDEGGVRLRLRPIVGSRDARSPGERPARRVRTSRQQTRAQAEIAITRA